MPPVALSTRHYALVEDVFTLANNKDTFGKDFGPAPIPLALDYISEGHRCTSESVFTRLPIIVTYQIVQLIDISDLANFALVNRDCRQWARSRQFASVKLDYSERAEGILNVLTQEHQERASNNGKTRFPAIGVCVRHLIVNTDAKWVTRRHGKASNPEEAKGMTLSPLLSKLLHLASPQLESLAWECIHIPGKPVLLEDCVDGAPFFPRLQDLKIEFNTPYHPAWLPVLIQPGERSPLRHLEMDIGAGLKPAMFFHECGTLPHLETLVWSNIREKDLEFAFPPLKAFLEANSQIRKFRLSWPAPSEFLGRQLLPLICSSFHNLTSLSLIWKEENIPYDALDQIATLRNLEQLWLSAGEQRGCEYTWAIDHVAICSRVQQLLKLRRLAFSRDTYVENNQPKQMYYEYRHPHEWYLLDPAEINLAPGETKTQKFRREWEEYHRQKMTSIARDIYAPYLPNLEWIYMGQVAMRIEREGGALDGSPLEAIPLTETRDSCWTFLKRNFGRERDLGPVWYEPEGSFVQKFP
ncbi:hypothetical protein GQ43DRAFT_473597 [Delitschia confertaspora ATCC 74209]|uniref:F-box domain-containing protein n=1 Tax=Delitschia confertaspora ATCC 74209 TaxID=1513339 RepID=A0A9P4JMG6_9PLEO|nr:hypothetical protein GQ43DRAFT_473597 [Delitschia confertaspora ATCC 74209]